MGNAIFQVFQLRNPWTHFQKIAQLIKSATASHIQTFGSVASKACLRKREVVTVRRLFFVFFCFLLTAKGPPVVPIIAVNGLNDAFWRHSHSLYGLVKKNWNLPPVAPKIGKFALRPMATLKSHNSGIRSRCLHQSGGFRGRAIKRNYSNFC